MSTTELCAPGVAEQEWPLERMHARRADPKERLEAATKGPLERLDLKSWGTADFKKRTSWDTLIKAAIKTGMSELTWDALELNELRWQRLHSLDSRRLVRGAGVQEFDESNFFAAVWGAAISLWSSPPETSVVPGRLGIRPIPPVWAIEHEADKNVCLADFLRRKAAEETGPTAEAPPEVLTLTEDDRARIHMADLSRLRHSHYVTVAVRAQGLLHGCRLSRHAYFAPAMNWRDLKCERLLEFAQSRDEEMVCGALCDRYLIASRRRASSLPASLMNHNSDCAAANATTPTHLFPL